MIDNHADPPRNYSEHLGPEYLHKLAVIGVIIEVWVNFWDLQNFGATLANPLDQLIELYAMLAGIGCLAVELGEMACAYNGPHNKLIELFPFLGYARGRGITYFVLGSLTASGGNLRPILGCLQLWGGLYLMAVSVALIVKAPPDSSSAAQRNAEHAASQAATPAQPDSGNQMTVHVFAVGALGVCCFVNAWDLTDMWSNIFKPLDQLMELYCVIGTLVCLSLECTYVAFGGTLTPECVLKWFPFLNRKDGKGVSYIVLGSITAAGGSPYPKYKQHYMRTIIQFFGGIALLGVGAVQMFLAFQKPPNNQADQEMRQGLQEERK